MKLKTAIYCLLVVLLSLASNGCVISDYSLFPQLPSTNHSDPCYAKQQALRTDNAYFAKTLSDSLLASFMGELPQLIKSTISGRRGYSGYNMNRKVRTMISTELNKGTQDYLTLLTKKSGGDQFAMTRNINAQAFQDSEHLENTKYKIKKLQSCRRAQQASINRRYQRGAIDHREKEIAYRQLLSQARQDQRLIDQVLGHSRDRVNVYIEADHYVSTGESINANDYLGRSISPSNTYYARKNVNIRGGPSTRFSRVGRVRQGRQVQVIQKVAGKNWYEINYQGTIAYVYKPLLSRTRVSTARRARRTTHVGSGVKKVEHAYYKADEEKQEFDKMVAQVEQETKKTGL